MNQLDARALNHVNAVLYNNGSLYIMEAQTEYEGEQGAVTPAKSIWLNTTPAKALRDFLIEKYPPEELTRLRGIEQALQDYMTMPGGGTAEDVFAWVESTTGYISDPPVTKDEQIARLTAENTALKKAQLKEVDDARD
ncbi:hypothetical protein [Paenibacillus methanolicus]|uniref:Uncharacterized protein n=1 Tax=Paenibacillus methanolicus TaxID=582686 RepID=A0A5S5BPN5_9BACL|nr:hypothetical protein [Paenibacillus methanolicus]TYP68914.1 hypothetical protein BCM02_11732 [Paenibacillus methanolicus]